MEKVESVRTLFNGAVKAETVIQVIAVVVVGAICIAILKGLAKKIALLAAAGVLVFAVANGYINAPEELVDIATKVQDKGSDVYVFIMANKDKVKIEGTSISILVGDRWISTDDIKSFVRVDEETVSISLGDEDIAIQDETVLTLLEMLSDE